MKDSARARRLLETYDGPERERGRRALREMLAKLGVPPPEGLED